MSTNKHDLLIELGTEELPPKALPKLSAAFEKLLTDKLREQQLDFTSSKAFATPRRLAVLIKALDEQQQDQENTRFGPAVQAAFADDGKPTPAAMGFAKSCGVEVEDLSRAEKDGVEKLCYQKTQKGQPTTALLENILVEALAQLPIPKRMRWGSSRAEFVRPVHWLLVLFGDKPVAVSVFDIKSGATTMGHRFMHNEAITISKPDDYESALENPGKVIADFGKRREQIRELVEAEGNKLSATPMIDDDLLNEVTALVEYPVALTGDFDPRFLEVPPEALILTMKSHQKCFCLTDEKGELIPKFVAVSNLLSKDPQQVVEGNERVIRPRLADASFFFETDKNKTLESRCPDLEKLKFQDKLGSVGAKSARVARLASWIAEQVGGDSQLAARAAKLGKCDLLTNMVGEFAELQGLMGYYYALNDGEPEAVAIALNEQYQPRFAGAPVPETLNGAIVALADKLDTTVGMFGINQPPTGSKDPFALRRSALGILRILIEKELDLDLQASIAYSAEGFAGLNLAEKTSESVFDFMLDRFKAWYADEGIASGVFQSVFVLKPTRPLDFHRRIQAVNSFASLDEAAALAAANKRVSNLLAKQEAGSVSANVDESLLTDAAEKSLFSEVKDCELEVGPLFEAGNYKEGLQQLAKLKDSVDSFFDDVLVMAEDEQLKLNRLALLSRLRNLFLATADISHLHAN